MEATNNTIITITNNGQTTTSSSINTIVCESED